MTKRIIALALALVLTVAAGCSKSKSGGNEPNKPDTPKQEEPKGPVEGGILNLSMFSAPKGVFNPILYEDKYDSNIIGLVFDGLLRRNENLEHICNLCESFEISPDNKTVTFKLRKDVKWHDGKPFTSKDVAFTFRAMIHPDYTGVRTGDYAALVGVEKMLNAREELTKQVDEKKMSPEAAAQQKMADWEAWLNGDGKQAINVIDEYTISFSTDEPYAPFLDNLAFSIIPAHVFEGTPIGQMENHPAIKQPIGVGPYKFVQYVTDGYVELTRNESYHMGKPYIPTVIYKIANQDVAIGQLKSGELDYVEMAPKDVELVEGDKSISIYTRPDFGYQYMGLNHDHPILKDRKVRQAMMYAINRKAMVDTLLKGYGTVMNSHMPPALWAYDASSLNAYEYNPEKAAALLAEAGWTQKNDEGYLVKDGEVFAITLKYPSGNKVREASAPLIQAHLKAVGIKVDVQMMEFSTLVTTVFDERNMDAWLMGWSLALDPDPGAIFLSNNKWGRVTGWINSRNEELIRQGTRVLKVAERKPIYVEWAKILNDELPYIFLYSQNAIDAVRTDKVQGLKPDARGTLWNVWELWIAKDKQ
ncbi:MAG: peptide-binding protein [Bacillota bacterium]